MYQRKTRRFRRRSNGRGRQRHLNGDHPPRLTSNSFNNGHPRNSFRSLQSAEKLHEKYNALAKEALSSGDKILSENYFQHADHFCRMIDDKIKNQNYNKNQNESNNLVTEDKQSSSNPTNSEEKK
tara:strand:- start:1613 stop:1987 length:375 start_codon:yes stop_codon:yes gene_type:complete